MLRIFVRYNFRHGNRRILNNRDQFYQEYTQNSDHFPYDMFYFHRMCLKKKNQFCIFYQWQTNFPKFRMRFVIGWRYIVTFTWCFTSFSQKSVVTSIAAMSRNSITCLISATSWAWKVAINSEETRNAFLTTQDRITVLTISTSQTTVFTISIFNTQFTIRPVVAKHAVSTS